MSPSKLSDSAHNPPNSPYYVNKSGKRINKACNECKGHKIQCHPLNDFADGTFTGSCQRCATFNLACCFSAWKKRGRPFNSRSKQDTKPQQQEQQQQAESTKE